LKICPELSHAGRIANLKSRLAQWRKEQGDEGKVYNEPGLLDDRESWHPDFFQAIPGMKKEETQARQLLCSYPCASESRFHLRNGT
jgi:hypothetical protein